jgi:hypothetical protein
MPSISKARCGECCSNAVNVTCFLESSVMSWSSCASGVLAESAKL